MKKDEFPTNVFIKDSLKEAEEIEKEEKEDEDRKPIQETKDH